MTPLESLIRQARGYLDEWGNKPLAERPALIISEEDVEQVARNFCELELVWQKRDEREKSLMLRNTQQGLREGNMLLMGFRVFTVEGLAKADIRE